MRIVIVNQNFTLMKKYIPHLFFLSLLGLINTPFLNGQETIEPVSEEITPEHFYAFYKGEELTHPYFAIEYITSHSLNGLKYKAWKAGGNGLLFIEKGEKITGASRSMIDEDDVDLKYSTEWKGLVIKIERTEEFLAQHAERDDISFYAQYKKDMETTGKVLKMAVVYYAVSTAVIAALTIGLAAFTFSKMA